MNHRSNRLMRLMLVAAVASTSLAFAQQQQQAAPGDQYSGVSQPPPDDTIVANPDVAPVARPAKPSPVVAANPPVYSPAPQPYVAPAQPATTASTVNSADYDIVTSVPSPAAPPPSITADATLNTRANPDADIVSVVPSSRNQLPEGTDIRVRLTQRLSTKETAAGSPFQGEVTTAVYKDGRVIIPVGATLKGRVMNVTQGHHFGSAATLRLRPDFVLLPDGSAYHLYAQVIRSRASGTRTDSEGGIQPSSHIVKKLGEYGVGIGAGALVGAHFAGPHGALVGSVVGAGIVTTHLLLQHPQAAVVPEGSEIVFSLTEPMELTPTRN